MQVKKTQHSDTSLTLTVVATDADLAPIKQQAVQRLGKNIKLQGFRPGKAPQALVEKNIDPAALQTEVVEEAINHYYGKAMGEYRLRPVARPEIGIKKFVPFTTLEFDAKVEVVGEIKLPDYKKIKKTMPKVSVTAKDVDEVIEAIRKQSSEKKDVDRAAKDGDQVWIDFKGVDAKGEPVQGAEGKNYPLALGSDTFIPGFEKNLIGTKANDEKTFTLTFPKDYGVKALANKKVTFTVTVTKVQEVVLPEIDDELAKKAGPFKDVKHLKEDIKTELTREREQQAQREVQEELVKEIAAKSKVSIPEILVTEQTEAMLREHKQNLMYRGQTIEEFLKAEGKTEEEYRDKVLKPAATERIKAGLVLSEIAEAEKLEVTQEELQKHREELKLRYHQDAQMQAELDKPENLRDLAMRLLTEKTINKLLDYAA